MSDGQKQKKATLDRSLYRAYSMIIFCVFKTKLGRGFSKPQCPK
jgi:hypothetical protein